MPNNNELIILKETILPGESKTINMEIAKLQTMTKLKIPIIVERSKKPGPTVLFRRVCMAMKLMVLKLCAN